MNTPPPLIAEFITTCDTYTTLMRSALAAVATSGDDAPQLRALAAQARTLDRQRDGLLHALRAAGYTQSAVEHALVAAGRQDLVDDLDVLAELGD